MNMGDGPRLRGRRTRGGRAMQAIALLALILIAAPVTALAGEKTLLPEAADPFADVVPAAMDSARDAVDRLSSVAMVVTLDPAASTIGGEMTVDWRNPAPEPLSEVWFRLFPNAFYYGDGGLAVSDLAVDGEAVRGELTLDDTALRVPLPRPVAPGARAELTLTFTTTVPADSKGSYGIFTHDTGNGSWVLADWHPILAVWEEDGGWELPEVTSFGDPTYAPAVFYDVQIAAPADLTVATSGIAVAEQTGNDGTITRRYIAGPARDFALVADDDQTPQTATTGETEIQLWTAPDGDAVTNEKTLEIAAAALRYYDETFGPYPAREIDLVETDPAGALGIAWTGLIFLDGPSLLGTYGEYDPEGLAAVVGHEVSHLWWGIQVGGDSNAHGFIQEGLATVSSILFLEEYLGPEAAAAELDAWVIGPARDLLDEGDAIVDLPLAEGQNEGIRSDATYGKGSLGFFAIRKEIGAEAFAAGLREAASRYAWDEMTPEQLRGAFASASGKDLDALWSHWFDEAAMTRDEIDAIATSFG
ncbi:MAG: M1 family metallopeptidase [Thermomicrobiales bacterium]